MSAVEFYVGMRVIAMNREGKIVKCQDQGSYDVRFPDSDVVQNIRREHITPFETISVAKQVGGPPPASYTASASVGPPVYNAVQYQHQQYPQHQHQPQFQPQQFQQQQSQQYQYPNSAPQQQQYQSPNSLQQGHFVGVTGIPVYGGGGNTGVVSVTASPAFLTVPLNNVNTEANANKLPGFEHAPPLGQPFRDLFDCSTPFCMACWCPCVLGGQVSEKIQNVGSYGTIVCLYLVLCFFFFILWAVLSNVLIWLLLWVVWAVFVMMLRSKVRQMWQIPGDGCEDCGVSFCCTACSLSQVKL
jgi:Cys-rich protein (TIGR01571 family)